MGITGVRVFDSDDAIDWATELIEGPAGFVESTLRAYRKGDDEHEYRALAAAEVIATWRGHPGGSVPNSVQVWVNERKRGPRFAVVALAVKVVRDLAVESVVRDEMEANLLLPEWLAYMEDLLTRLEAEAISLPPPKRKRVRVKPGLVVQFELPDGRFAYGRLSGSALAIYTQLSSKPRTPPPRDGSRVQGSGVCCCLGSGRSY